MARRQSVSASFAILGPAGSRRLDPSSASRARATPGKHYGPPFPQKLLPSIGRATNFMSLCGLRSRNIEALSTPWFLAPASRCSAPVTTVGLISFIPRIPAFNPEKSSRSGRFNKDPTFAWSPPRFPWSHAIFYVQNGSQNRSRMMFPLPQIPGVPFPPGDPQPTAPGPVPPPIEPPPEPPLPTPPSPTPNPVPTIEPLPDPAQI
jgi:hypothetical protein